MKNKVFLSLAVLSVFVFLLSSCGQKAEEQSSTDLKEVQDFQKSMQGFEDLSTVINQLSVLKDQSQNVSETSTSEK